jgi:hypothetical protein
MIDMSEYRRAYVIAEPTCCGVPAPLNRIGRNVIHSPERCTIVV